MIEHIIRREYLHIVSSVFFSMWMLVLFIMLRRMRIRANLTKLKWYHKIQPMSFEVMCIVSGAFITFCAYLREPIDAGFGDWIPKSYLDLFAGWALGAAMFYILFRRFWYWIREWNEKED